MPVKRPRNQFHRKKKGQAGGGSRVKRIQTEEAWAKAMRSSESGYLVVHIVGVRLDRAAEQGSRRTAPCSPVRAASSTTWPLPCNLEPALVARARTRSLTCAPPAAARPRCPSRAPQSRRTLTPRCAQPASGSQMFKTYFASLSGQKSLQKLTFAEAHAATIDVRVGWHRLRGAGRGREGSCEHAGDMWVRAGAPSVPQRGVRYLVPSAAHLPQRRDARGALCCPARCVRTLSRRSLIKSVNASQLLASAATRLAGCLLPPRDSITSASIPTLDPDPSPFNLKPLRS